jgi:hypothetical protein
MKHTDRVEILRALEADGRRLAEQERILAERDRLAPPLQKNS